VIRAAVLGSPISHSLSPRLHKSAYEFLKIPGEYSSFDVGLGSLQSFLGDKGEQWTGFSLTMPLKEEALTCANVIDPLVAKTTSGNTLINREGNWHLYSTDVLGFRSVWDATNNHRPSSVLIIGSGATARAAVAAFDSSDTQIHVLHRSTTREDSIRECAEHSSLMFHSWGSPQNFGDFELVINTTPKFAIDELAAEVSGNPNGTFFDVIYDPWPTEYAKQWSEMGGFVLGGLELLIAQGIEQIKLFTGSEIPTDELRQHLRKEFNL
jgi:shikimate dehydrogenase